MKEQNKKKKHHTTAIVLAAGQGTRMRSPLPKVLHPVAGMPMIVRILQQLRKLGVDEIRVVISPAQKLISAVVEPLGVSLRTQLHPFGTGDAVRAAGVEDLDGDVLIVNGDHPLVTAEHLLKAHEAFHLAKADLGVVTAHLDEPQQFGRIVRNQGKLQAIVEAKEASSETLKIREINTGIYFATAEFLQEHLPRLQKRADRSEVYLTDLVALGVESHSTVVPLDGSPELAFGVNTQKELAEATRRCFLEKAEALMESGVVIMDPRTAYVEDSVQIGAGSVLWPNVFLRGSTRLGSFVTVESNSCIIDSEVSESVQIRANSYFEKAQIGAQSTIGPFARLRPETVVGVGCHIGNFVEMKKVNFGAGSKAGHLTYLGDAKIGERVNIGCGTITCNYAPDHQKYQTVIGNDVFVGSDSQFVAPVQIGDGALIGSGSTITAAVPAGALAVARGKQRNIENYAKRIQDKVNRSRGEDSSPSEEKTTKTEKI